MRTLRRLVLAAALMGAGLVASPTGADAHVDACAGVGAMTTPLMVYPGLGPPVVAGPMTFTLPTCTAGGLFTIGTISGWCGYAWGAAVGPGGHTYAFVIVDGLMTLTGTITGEALVVPAVGQSCLAPGAALWVATGAVVLAP